eukprot:CAMPEP_0179234776 /NCGR_PEP_ID=MMETSP0797-20121207/13065_1 /TAXON_ID=47934 /ORGANISM="Dinophysis acuminata, Strain DAEP01" /LENGTH=535 /DNA_ID=CAMNT_0020941969 /DNA_START=65 /DNA_END=1668 /DNA_ORIENTATION=-
MKSNQGAPKIWRLAARSLLHCIAPAVAALLGLAPVQVGFCAGAAALWSLLEADVVYRCTPAANCRKLPFIFRFISACGLDVQACWLLTVDGGEGSPVNVQAALPAFWGPASESPAAVPPRMPSTLSVVLPCANEGEFVRKTVHAVFEGTPEDELKEIIVIDDASMPPVSKFLGDDDLKTHRARIIRHSVQQGLIRSKKDGGDHAQGDIVVFLDCHVKPMPGWTKAILRNLRENPKRVVVPAITSLNIDTWEEVSPYGGGRKMCLTWDADFFWCNEYPGPYVPIMSGGLLAMTKYWWNTTGGYDDQMKAWGGENLDQSLRTWLCGGEIMVAEGSRVAHMWREPSKPQTQLHYQIPTEHVRRNRLRAATAWMGPWAEKVLSFPQFEDFRPGGRLGLGSLAGIEALQGRLKCRGFDWYLDRFRDFYAATGALPDEVFNLRDSQTGLCMHHNMGVESSHAVTLVPCNRFSETQRFHAANSDARSHRCCSGIKLWDFNLCPGSWRWGDLHVEACSRYGGSGNQLFQVTADGLIVWKQRHG